MLKTILTILMLTTAAIAETDIAGVLSLPPVQHASYIAVKVTQPDSVPVGGVRWYNNDGGTVFPEVFLAATQPDGMPDLDLTAPLGSDVAGVHLGWSELIPTVPVLNDVGDLFAVFRLPAYEAIAEPGSGPGIGYRVSGDPAPVFLSADGEDWVPIGGGVDLLYETIPGTDKAGAAGFLFQRPDVPVWKTTLDRPAPNPFNPSTELKFTLAATELVDFAVYNLRGEKVRTLVHEKRDRGPHTTIWRGENDAGERVASGVYFARLTTETTVLRKRLVLLK